MFRIKKDTLDWAKGLVDDTELIADGCRGIYTGSRFVQLCYEFDEADSALLNPESEEYFDLIDELITQLSEAFAENNIPYYVNWNNGDILAIKEGIEF